MKLFAIVFPAGLSIAIKHEHVTAAALRFAVRAALVATIVAATVLVLKPALFDIIRRAPSTLRPPGRRHPQPVPGMSAADTIHYVDTPGATVRVRLGLAAEAPLEQRPAVLFILDPPNVVEHYDAHFLQLTRKGSVARAVAAVELPGFGFSYSTLRFGWHFEDYVRSVGAVLDALFPQESFPGGVIIVAPCVCAYVALRLAAERSAQISKLVLAQAPVWREEHAWSKRLDRPASLLSRPAIGQVLNAVFARTMARRWYRIATADMETAERMSLVAESALQRGACNCLATFTQHWFRSQGLFRTHDVPGPVLIQVGQPTLYLWGEKDRSHRRSTARSGLEAYAPHGIWEPLPDTGHFPDLEHSARFLDRLELFARHGA